MIRIYGRGAYALCGLVGLWAAAAWGGAVILEGDVWRYYKGTDDPPEQGGRWTDVSYNEGTNWLGPAPGGFGYSDEDDATRLTDMSNRYVSVFIRRVFTIADTDAVTHLTLALDYDDGLVAYLNGQEVARRNMPAGAVGYASVAAAAHEASRAGAPGAGSGIESQPKEWIALDPGLLLPGSNVLAVSGHNLSMDSSDLTLIAELYTNVTLVRGPILQMPTPGRLTVTWHTDSRTDSEVDFGPDAAYGVTVTNTQVTREHRVELPKLRPGSHYHYRIRSGGVNLASAVLRAPPAPGQPFRIAVIGDFGWTGQNPVLVARQVEAAAPDLLLTVGDNIYLHGQPGGYDPLWFQPYSNVLARVPVLPALGNHDVLASTGIWSLLNFDCPTNGPPGLEERNYSFDFGNAHIAVLDSNAFDDNEQYYTNRVGQRAAIRAWLANDLAQSTQTWTLVAYHHPPHTSRGVHDDEALMKSEIAPLLERYGVDLALQGHNHWYERINAINGVHYLTSGGGGGPLYAVQQSKAYSARLFNGLHSFLALDVNGGELLARCLDRTGAEQDRAVYSVSHPFNLDGLLDSTNWVRAANGLRLSAAIRGYQLYVAVQDAGEGSDHFVYVQRAAAPLQAANWSKSGQVMTWAAFLADENDNGYHAWYGAAEQVLDDPALARSMTSGLNNNGTNLNGALEGTLHLTNLFGAFPAELRLAAAPFATANGGALVTAAQVPAGNGDGNLDPEEFLAVPTRDLALDLPVASALAQATVEAGMPATLDATASAAPSGLPLSFAWTQVEGPTGWITGVTQALGTLTVTTNPPAATSVTVRVTANDTRFDAVAEAVIAVTPLVDGDDDGLSDAEEATGLDNVLTAPDPAGRVTRPDDPDTDDDGSGDGAEALAGTDPNEASSRLEVSGFDPVGSEWELRWPSASNRTYALLEMTNLMVPGVVVVSNIAADPPTNVYPLPAPGGPAGFYRLRVRPE